MCGAVKQLIAKYSTVKRSRTFLQYSQWSSRKMTVFLTPVAAVTTASMGVSLPCTGSSEVYTD